MYLTWRKDCIINEKTLDVNGTILSKRKQQKRLQILGANTEYFQLCSIKHGAVQPVRIDYGFRWRLRACKGFGFYLNCNL